MAWELLSWIWTLGITSVSLAGLGIFVLVKAHRTLTGRTYAAYCLSISWWSGCEALAHHAETVQSSLLLWKLSYIGVVCIPVFFTHFVISLLEPSAYLQRKIFIRICYISSLVIWGILHFTPFILNEMQPKFVFPFYPVVGRYFLPFLLWWLGLILYALTKLYQLYARSTGRAKTQFTYFFWSMLFAYLGGSTNFLPKLDIVIPGVMPYATFLVPLYAFVTAYAILHHQLLNISVVIRKTVIYSSLVACITIIYLILVFLAERIFQEALGYRSPIFSITLVIILGLIFHPLKQLIQKIVDRLLFKGSIEKLHEESLQLRQQLMRTDQLRAVGTFAAGMAHEIKNPLATLKIFAEQLPQRYNDPAFRERVARLIPQEVEKIDRIVREVLSVAKPTPPHLESVTLPKLIDDVVEFLSAQCLRQRVEIERRFDHQAPTVHADPTQLKQALLNVFLNSLEAMEQGGTLTITLTAADGHVDIGIHDTGRGIPNEVMARLGEPFVTGRPDGTGLGLPIVHSIMEAHGGKLNITTQKEIGTSVLLRLPAEQHVRMEGSPPIPLPEDKGEEAAGFSIRSAGPLEQKHPVNNKGDDT